MDKSPDVRDVSLGEVLRDLQTLITIPEEVLVLRKDPMFAETKAEERERIKKYSSKELLSKFMDLTNRLVMWETRITGLGKPPSVTERLVIWTLFIVGALHRKLSGHPYLSRHQYFAMLHLAERDSIVQEVSLRDLNGHDHGVQVQVARVKPTEETLCPKCECHCLVDAEAHTDGRYCFSCGWRSDEPKEEAASDEARKDGSAGGN